MTSDQIIAELRAALTQALVTPPGAAMLALVGKALDRSHAKQ